jgi:hypothetical protein
MYTPQLGDIGVTQITGDVGRLIRLGQWLNGTGFADFEHAFVVSEVIPSGGGQPPIIQIVEAEPGGAREVPLTEYNPRNIAWLHCPEPYRHAVAAAARAFTEPRPVPYSAADYFALAAHRLHLPIPWLRDYVKSSGHMICSQLVDRAAAEGGWHLFADGRWDGYVTPGDIWELIQQQDRPNWKRDFFTRSATRPDTPAQP